jgi:hypothetical protein
MGKLKKCCIHTNSGCLPSGASNLGCNEIVKEEFGMSLTPADKFEISELLAKFCYYSDYADYKALERLFAENPTTVTEGMGTFSGVEAQIQHSRESYEQTSGKNRHAMTNLWIEPDGDGALVRYFLLNVFAGFNPMEALLMTTGRFEDRVVRTKHGWRIAHRKYIPDQALPQAMDGSNLPKE